MTLPSKQPGHPRGSVLLMTLVYTVMFGALATAMVSFAVGNMRVGMAEKQTNGALAAAESGMGFLVTQLRNAGLPIIKEGSISKMAQPGTLWNGINIEGISSNSGLARQLAANINQCGAYVVSTNSAPAPTGTNPLIIPAIAVDKTVSDACFALTVSWDTSNPWTTDPYSGQALNTSYILLHLKSVGTSGLVSRTVTMDVLLQKTIRYSVFSNIAIQIGKNTIVSGDVVSTWSDFTKGPPVWTLSDFRHLSGQAQLDTDLVNFRAFLATNDPTFDNRVDLRNNATVAAAAAAKGFYDRNGDGFIDEYDVFLKRVDSAHTGKVTQQQFSDSNGLPMDDQLFVLLDTLNPPFQSAAAPRPGLTYNPSPSATTSLNQWLGILDNSMGYDGNGIIDQNDGYAKIKGTIKTSVSATAWDTWAKNTSSSGGAKYGTGLREQLQGPIIPADSTQQPVQFAYSGPDVPTITPQNFDTSGYATQTGSNGNYAGNVKNAAVDGTGLPTVTGYVITGANATEASTVTEAQPQGAATPQSTYKRPVFKNVHFKNCKIAKGTNALFQNCVFDGVTYVDLNPAVVTGGSVGTLLDGTKGIVGGTPTSDPNQGNTWAQTMISGSFTNTTVLTATNSVGFQQGNNLRFDTCQINGPMASAVPTAYSHFANNWEFSGSTVFNNTTDPTATVLAPNTNLDCGSFQAPPSGPLPASSITGVVVAGNVNMRGASWNVDGSIIITGIGGMNTTLGYFGPTDTSTDPNAVPAGGFGRIYLRYNPTRAMPDGISIPLTLITQPQTYQIQ